MNDMDILPWHEENWQQFLGARAEQRLAHGLLLRGPSGLGKRRFADALAARLLCEQGGERACGKCRGCALRLSGNHPDLFIVGPDEDKTQIRVEQIRELITKLALSSQMCGYKIVIIDPADALNVNAQNSLLKTLEEPPGATQLLLVTSRPASLAPTVLSRCQMLWFRSPNPDTAEQWLSRDDPDTDWRVPLRLAGGAPLRARELARAGVGKLDERLAKDLLSMLSGRSDPVTVAEEWAADQPMLRLRWLQRLVYSLVQWGLTGAEPELVHSSLTKSLQKPIAATSVKHLFRYLDAVERVISLSDRTINLVLTIVPLMTIWAGGPRFDQTQTETL